MKKITLILLGTLLLAACKKEEPKQYSHWKVDGVAYSSNNVIAEEGYHRPISAIRCRDKIRFGISFNIGELPHYGEFPIQHYTGDPSVANVWFYFDTVAFRMLENTMPTLKATEQNGKAQYILSQAWFRKSTPPYDTVLIEGIFNEP